MLARHWDVEPPKRAELLRQSRWGAAEIRWDPLRSPFPRQHGGFSCFIGLAGIVPGTGSDLRLNRDLAEAILHAAHDMGVARVLLSSSSAVYGAAKGRHAFREEDPPGPRNAYGEAKSEMEAVCAPWRTRGMEICCLRIGNVCGADMLFTNSSRAAAGEMLHIDRFDDGTGPERSYIGPATLARVIETLARHPAPLPETLNLAAPEPVAMTDLASAADMRWTWKLAPASALQRITLDCGRLAKLHSFTASDSDPVEMVRQWLRLRDPK
ncbi:NAD-dependent epimerase/dehydratase family protein [Paracoccus methylarcula]|uniref:NAD(P)-dependent oxidoreductase n=1 Tax=Paracoccus methylarcula TaxID=72022 RepID=A0A3R7PQ14_9RHOB|nr:NAD(P)-dependent oxidoreductase [Paracoccus methylarcula]RNF34707.1 NAD(P)-dependent oxidoreductase [Paracoccus methylarcula]